MTADSFEHNRGVILIVDDEPFALQYLQSLLEGEGYAVASATNGRLALDQVKERQPELVLLDIMMPIMDGYETCRRLKQNPEFADLPVLFLSSLDNADEKMNAFAVGGVDYVTKPFSKREILVRVKNHLTMYRIRNRLSSELDQRQLELIRQENEVRDVNTALKVLLTAIEREKQDLAATVQFNADKLIIPRISKMVEVESPEERKELFKLIRQNFQQLTESLVPGRQNLTMTLTPTELQVANLIKQDKTSKEISRICNMSPSTVASHRKMIRKKLGITNKRVNLRAILSSAEV